MRLPNMLRLQLRSLFARRQIELELDEELRYHVERQIDEYIAAGMSPEDARSIASRTVGNIEQRKEECRDMRGLNWFDNAVQDFRYAIRQLVKSPGFTCTAIFILGLGIAAAITIFGLVEASLIKPLPYRDQSKLVGVFEATPKNAQVPLSYFNFADWKKLNTVFSSIDAYALNGGFTLNDGSGAEQVTGTRVSSGFFRTLGVIPAFGRDFLANEDSPAANTVMISYAAWQTRFGARTDVLGKMIPLNGIPRTIIGVLPRDFHFAPFGAADFWTTLRSTGSCEQSRGCRNLKAIARLKDGVSIEMATVGMQVVAQQLQRQYPDTNREIDGATIVPLREIIAGDIRSILLVLLSGSVVLLLIACLNVTTLLLARSDSRRREIAVRGALGATPARLLRQFAVEGLVLATAGGALALVLAEWGMRLLISLVPAQKLDSMPYLRELGPNSHTIAFACLLTLLASILFALIPTIRVSLTEKMDGLKEGTRGNVGLMWRRFGANLVVVEVALAMVLMSSAGLLGKSLYSLLRVDTGIQTDGLATAGLRWSQGNYATKDAQVALGRQIVGRISVLPGVTSAAISLTTPTDSIWGTASFHTAGQPNRGENNEVLNRQVSAGYFTTLRARLMRGRYFSESEDSSKPLVAIINRSLASKYFGGKDPVGKQIYFDWAPEAPMEIVGLVDDIKEGPIEAPNMPVLYVPFNQKPVAWFAILVRTSSSDQTVLSPIRAVIHKIDRDISVHRLEMMTDKIHDSHAAYLHRSSAWLVGSFAGIAFVLGVLGLYGVVAYSVSHRSREIGIRMALGAEPSIVQRLIIGEAARLVGAGTILGIGGSVAAANLIRGLFYGVNPWDVPTLTIVASVLILAALLASYIPARRAALVAPMEALRSE